MTIIKTACIVFIAIIAAARPMCAQLRPLDPIDFASFGGQSVRMQAGFGVYFDQHASLAGTRGRLWDLGEVRTSIRTGRIAIELSGTVFRVFHDEVIISEPAGGARPPPPDGRRHDAGDFRVATVVLLTAPQSATAVAVRFGARLPTTDNRIGLERDAMDFFATFAGRRALGGFALGIETGLSVNGTRLTAYEQSDVLVYAITTELRVRGLTPFVMAVGQQDFHDWAPRGNEDLSEIRVGVRAGDRRWINVAWVHGMTDSSPTSGVQLSVGASVGGR